MPKKGLAAEFRRRHAEASQAAGKNLKAKTLVEITLRGIAELPDTERQGIALWVREQANFLEQQGGNLSATYTARYCAR